MYQRYFEDCEVQSVFKKEYVSLWAGWLGKANIHKLDEVTEQDWQKFNDFLTLLSETFSIKEAIFDSEELIEVNNINSVLASYSESMAKEAPMFSKFVIPELDCVITEEWDYTYIIWYKDSQVIDRLAPFIKSAKLCHFS